MDPINRDPIHIWLTFLFLFSMLLEREKIFQKKKKSSRNYCLFAQLFHENVFKIGVQYITGNRKILHSFKTHSSCDESPILHRSEPNFRQIRRSNSPPLASTADRA